MANVISDGNMSFYAVDQDGNEYPIETGVVEATLIRKDIDPAKFERMYKRKFTLSLSNAQISDEFQDFINREIILKTKDYHESPLPAYFKRVSLKGRTLFIAER